MHGGGKPALRGSANCLQRLREVIVVCFQVDLAKSIEAVLPEQRVHAAL